MSKLTQKDLILLIKEMARSPRLAPSLLDRQTTDRYTKLLNHVNDMLKYGVHKYPQLIDSNGEPAFGLDDSVLQDRKLRYFYFHLSQHNDNIENDDGYSLDKRIFNSNLEMNKFLDSLNITKKTEPTTKVRVTLAIIHKIKQNPEWFNSKNFENTLFDPKNLANFINLTREKFHSTSIAAAKNREDQYGYGIRDLDAIKSATRDSISAKNKAEGYAKRRKRSSI